MDANAFSTGTIVSAGLRSERKEVPVNMREEISLRKLTPFLTQYQNFFHTRLSFFSSTFPRLFFSRSYAPQNVSLCAPHAQMGFGTLNRQTRFSLSKKVL